MRTTPWLFVLPLQGEIFRVAFLLFLGRCPQAMLFQSFGLERPTVRDRSGVAHRLCCFSPSDWKGQPCETGQALPTGYVVSVLRTGKANRARQVRRCPQAMLFQSFGLERPTVRDRSGVAHRLCCFSPSDCKAQPQTTTIDVSLTPTSRNQMYWPKRAAFNSQGTEMRLSVSQSPPPGPAAIAAPRNRSCPRASACAQ